MDSTWTECTSRAARLASMLVAGALVSACATSARDAALAGAAGDGPGDLRRAQAVSAEPVRNLPKSRIGNAPEYTVFGQRYAVLDSAEGFRERGVASWYGSKFHGRDTSSGERYDMHLMTAAHKHLPLPTFVRVTRTDNGESVVVKVNDRGPFVDDRIIDLSFGAAARLGMLDGGTAPVEVVAVSTHHVEDSDVDLASIEGSSAIAQADPAPSQALAIDQDTVHWIQIGAYSDDQNASGELHRVAAKLGVPGRVEHNTADALYRVQLGPLAAASAESTLAALASVGVQSYTMVSGAP